MLKVKDEIIQIIPNTKYLSASELTTLRCIEIPTITSGLKRTNVENTTEEENVLDKLYENLQSHLSRPRIERLSGRAVGVWDSDKNFVRVERKDGKFANIGFSVEGQLYLEYYEALFLLEVNRLQLEYNSTVMSIEQAYLLLLGEQQSPKYHKYLVYSNLTRGGYILVNHENKHFQNHQINSETDCVWAILDAELQNETVSDYIKKTPYFAKVKQNFEGAKNIIKKQIETKQENVIVGDSGIRTDLTFWPKMNSSLKRKINDKDSQSEWLTAKRHCNYARNVFQRSIVNFLKDEDEYKQFKEMFDKFDIVPLRLNNKKSQNFEDHISESETEEEDEKPDVSMLHINFDVYLHNEGFRKSSPHLPNFRVIVMQPNQRFPTHDEISLVHRLQLNPVPLLIVSVNDSKQMQAFLYYFS